MKKFGVFSHYFFFFFLKRDGYGMGLFFLKKPLVWQDMKTVA